MTAEAGGLFGNCAPGTQAVRFVTERRDPDFVVERWMKSDSEALCVSQIMIDCTGLRPFVAAPGDPGNALDLASVDIETVIDIAYGGSCTAGKREDFEAHH